MKSARSEEYFSRGILVSSRTESLPHAYHTVHPAGKRLEGLERAERREILS